MPTPALLLVIATLLPLAAFLLLMFIGKRMGSPLAGYVGTAFIVGSFVCSLFAMVGWLNGGRYNSPIGPIEFGAGKNPINMPMPWIPVGGGVGQDHPGYLDVGVYVDSLTIVMFNMITLVSAVVHIFSIGYMREDKRFPRFFTYLGLFCFSMLGLVLGGTALQLFIFWELVGLCSYLLIGFWYEKKSASNAAIKAFVVNRVGDFGFLIGFGILFYHLGNVTLPNMYVALNGAGDGHAVVLANGMTISSTLLTVMGIGLFFGAIGKSAQFPLHVWLPDAMEGPTPVSALIHAATMVAAGVYLTARIFPILSPDAKLFIAIIGTITLTMAALIALAQSDIKKVLAFSTLSQLGYMILAIGIGSWVGGLFHLITHAFFKALLFLGSGSVIHAAHHEQEMPQYGGLMRKIPVTAITFFIAVLAIAGTGYEGLGLSGYYSKDTILGHAGAFAVMASEHGSKFYWLFFILPAGIAYVTAFYMMRCWMLTFWGKPRNQHLYDNAHETPILWFPLVVLAVMSIIGGGGLLGVRGMLGKAVKENESYCNAIRPAGTAEIHVFARMWPEPEDKLRAGSQVKEWADTGETLVHSYVAFAFVIGIGLGFLLYMRGYAVANALMKIAPLRLIHTWLYRRMYFDELYLAIFVGLIMGLSKLSAAFDKYVVDGLVNLLGWLVKMTAFAAGLNDKYVVDGTVNGLGQLTKDIGSAVRAPQTGRIRMYVTVLMIAVALGLAGAIMVVLSK
jgi:NADH-quinone oxidoreductase subunit L